MKASVFFLKNMFYNIKNNFFVSITHPIFASVKAKRVFDIQSDTNLTESSFSTINFKRLIIMELFFLILAVMFLLEEAKEKAEEAKNKEQSNRL